MRLTLSLLILAVVSAATGIDQQEMEESDFYTADDFEPKEGGLRQQMMTLSLIIPVRPTRQTIMEWTTSTSTLVCTKYTDTPCVVRTSVVERPERPSRRPARPGRPSAVSPSRKSPFAIVDGGKGIMIDEDYADQFAILPSRIQRVESTQLPTFSEREARAADPQYVLMYRNPNRDIEPGFQPNDLFKSMATPMNRRFSRPVLNLQRQFLQNYWSVTRRSTITELTVSTSTPLCSTTGSIPQCAISDNFRC
ncbi:uncharacterized protein LOC124341279 [Daphnia pulicaria]|uniref:uncharacterized protein LOC124341279 n=1 Tax=Daphnia pulicaria TaxID=35523 RepID=UPI001EECB7EF|nr:uncharacterized protein LOC124341279 [Daphnia pulicaria]